MNYKDSFLIEHDIALPVLLKLSSTSRKVLRVRFVHPSPLSNVTSHSENEVQLVSSLL